MSDKENDTVSTEGDPHVQVLDDIGARRLKDALGDMYMGISCSNCSSIRVIRAGACGVCLDCGSSEGCG